MPLVAFWALTLLNYNIKPNTPIASLNNKRISLPFINMRTIRNYPQFTHFACLPFTTPAQRQCIKSLQEQIRSIVDQKYQKQAFIESNYLLAHVTLGMFVLHRQDTRDKFVKIFQEIKEQLGNVLGETRLAFSRVNYFSKYNPKTKQKQVSLFYLQLQKDQNLAKIVKAADILIRKMLHSQLIINSELKQMRISYDHNENLYKNQQYHLTLFRVKGVVEDQKFKEIFKEISQQFMKEIAFQCQRMEVSDRSQHCEEGGFYQPLEQIILEPYKKKKAMMTVQVDI